MSSASVKFVTPEEYLERERLAETKSEYIQGQIFAMAGASEAHNLIVLNLAGELKQALKHRGCRVYASDLRLQVTSAGVYTYPDVMVACGKPELADRHADVLLNPVLIIEVLSKSTEAYDRGEKFEFYRGLPSLKEYVLAAQDKMHVEVWTRKADNSWSAAEVRGKGAVQFQSIQVELLMAEIYDQVDLPLN